MGYRIVFCHKSEVYHVGGGTLNMGSPAKTYLNFRNNLFLLFKNLKPGKVFTAISRRFILDGIAGFKFLLGGEFRFFIAVIKAHFAFYTMLRKFRNKRKHNISELFTTYNHKEIYSSSIVYDFFMKKKKSFKDLNF